MYEGERSELKDKLDKALEEVAKEMHKEFNKELIIDIYEGWSTNDESDSNRYWMFSAELPIRDSIAFTGRGGLKLFLQNNIYRNIVFVYNGIRIPPEEKEKFLEYVNRK